MPVAMLRGIVEAEGSIGQTHPREDEAGGSTQKCQLGEHSRDESLRAVPGEGSVGGLKVRWAPKCGCLLLVESGKGANLPFPSPQGAAALGSRG